MNHDNSQIPVRPVEPDNPPNRVLFWSLVALSIALVLLGVGVYNWIEVNAQSRIYERQLATGNPQIEALRAEEKAELTTYEVIDGEKGVYRIPVSEAIDIVAKNPSLLQSKGGGN